MHLNRRIREHFQSLSEWRLDFLVCMLVAAAVTPPDPFSLLAVGIPLSVIWLFIRIIIVRRLASRG